MDITFKTGNFDNFTKFIDEKIKGSFSKVRYNLIPLIEKCILSMLNNTENFSRESIDAVPEITADKKSISFELLYNVPDFQATGIPMDAVTKDETAIKDYLVANLPEGGDIETEINIQDGSVKITYRIEFSQLPSPK